MTSSRGPRWEEGLKAPTTLRPYQEEAVVAYLASDGHASLAMCPGSGKTIVACAILKELAARDFQENHPLRPPHIPWSFRSLVVVPTLVLKDQWEKVLLREGIGSAEIVTYAWAAQHVEDEAFWSQFNVIVWDEMHHLGFGQEFRQLLVPAYKARYSLGLSATPPQPKDGEENVAIQVMPVVYTYTFSRGQDEGYTAQIEIRPVGVKLTEEERAEYKRLTDLIQRGIARWGIERYVSRPVDVDPITGANIYGGQVTTQRKQLVATAEEKYEKLSVLVADQLVAGKHRIFVWSEFIDALEKAKRKLNVGGAPCAELITGKTPKKERRRIIEQAWGKEFPVLLVAKVGEEGLDAPEADVGFLMAGAKTSRQNVQRLGRLLRPIPGKKAVLYVIFAERTSDERIIPLLDMATE